MRLAVSGVVLTVLALAGGCSRQNDGGGASYAYDAAADMAAAEADANAAAAQQLAQEQARREAQLVIENGCIDRVIRADLATEPYGYTPDRATAMRAIDMSGCPSDFQVAYVQHIQAWEKTIRIRAALRQLDTGGNFGGAALTDLVGGALGIQTRAIGSHLDAIDTLQRENEIAGQQINDTYEIVTTLARSRGLTVPTQ